MKSRPSIVEVADALRAVCGPPPAPAVTDPWEQVVLLNASYLVDDDRRPEVLETLRERVGLDPRGLDAVPREVLEEAPEDVAFRLDAYLLLRRHGKATCKNTRPRCEGCALERECAFARGP